MKRAIFLIALMLMAAVPAFAQSTEFGVMAGASRRFIDRVLGVPIPNTDPVERERFLENEFSLSNSAVDLYWSIELEEDTRLKFKVGRIETPVAFAVENPNFKKDANPPDPNQPEFFRRDVEGEIQHASAIIDYRFDEPWGSTGIFGGLGLYRQSGEGFDSEQDFGFQFGVNADFPITRQYGVVTEATYHWSRGPFRPRYFTLTGGLRIAF